MDPTKWDYPLVFIEVLKQNGTSFIKLEPRPILHSEDATYFSGKKGIGEEIM